MLLAAAKNDHAEAKAHDEHKAEKKDEGFNPIAELFDRYSVWKTVDFSTGGKTYHGTEFIEKWNTSVGTTDPHNPSVLAISQHVVMMWLAAAVVLIIGLYVTLLRNSRIPRGLRNFIEPIALFVRNEIARPNIRNYHAHHDHGDHGHQHGGEAHAKDGDHGHEHKDHADHGHNHEPENPHKLADKFAPFLLCTFLFIATMNLMGLIPGSTTPTSAITVTMGLALVTLTTYLVGAVVLQGPIGFVKNLVPYQFSTKPLDLAIWGMLLVIEAVGLLTKPFALTVRLFANMTAGHCIILSLLFVNLLVSNMVGGWWPLASGVPTVLMSVAIYGLEIFVGILQAYIFTYLSAIFIGGYLAPEH